MISALKKGTKVNTAFDEYTLKSKVGEGGNGKVFSATNSDGEWFAIKFVEQNIPRDKLKRFKNEISFCEHHNHKNIVKIEDRGYACFNGIDCVFYVMPLYSETLKKKMNDGIPYDKVVDIFVGILEGLKYAHEHNAIHRDIKPENIMFKENSYEPIICDFGIAHFAEEDLLTIVETKATDRMANFQYSAPEQRKRGCNVSYQTDIYALSLILNEMFTGEIPQASGYKRIGDIAPDYKYLDDLFEKLFKQEPEERLYPEDLIITELAALTEKYKRELEKAKLKAIKDELVKPEKFETQIVDVKFRNNGVYFFFDTALPQEWFSMLRHGRYTHSVVSIYAPDKLEKINSNTIVMPLSYYANSENLVTGIVCCVEDWVKKVNCEYSKEKQKQAIIEQQRKEEERLQQIEKIENEQKINDSLHSLLKGWRKKE